jgi:hypothetical protein
VKYDSSVAELDNMYVHLTNVSVQKHGVTQRTPCGAPGNVLFAGRVQFHARGQTQRAESSLAPGKYQREASHGEVVRSNQLVDHSLVESCGAGDRHGSALLRVLRLRHHHRQQTKTLADRSIDLWLVFAR